MSGGYAISGKLKVIKYVIGLVNTEFDQLPQDMQKVILGLYCYNEKQYEKARRYFEMAYKINPNNFEIVHNLALMINDEEQAKNLHEEARKLNPQLFENYQKEFGDQFGFTLIFADIGG